MSLLEGAFAYADRGWHVFPLHGIVNGRCTCGRRDCSSPGKHPLTRHGVKDASTDPDAICGWWSGSPIANIGVATGERSRLIVVDVDLPRALESLDRLIHKLPRTLTGLTGGGGLHLLYRACFQERVRNRTNSLPGMRDLRGVDLRGDGGYIVVPPSCHLSGNQYRWLDATHPTAEIPAWLAEPVGQRSEVLAPQAPRFTDGDGTPYGLAALADEVERVRSAPVGARNHTLNRAAFCIAQLVGGRELGESLAKASLVSAGQAAGLSNQEVDRTVLSGFRAGFLHGRSARLPGCSTERKT